MEFREQLSAAIFSSVQFCDNNTSQERRRKTITKCPLGPHFKNKCNLKEKKWNIIKNVVHRNIMAITIKPQLYNIFTSTINLVSPSIIFFIQSKL